MTHGKAACGLLRGRVGVLGMLGESHGIWADLRKQRKIKYRDRDIMDYQHADFRGDSGVRFVCRLKGGAPKGAPPGHNRPQCGRFSASTKVHLFGALVTCQVVGFCWRPRKYKANGVFIGAPCRWF